MIHAVLVEIDNSEDLKQRIGQMVKCHPYKDLEELTTKLAEMNLCAKIYTLEKFGHKFNEFELDYDYENGYLAFIDIKDKE